MDEFPEIPENINILPEKPPTNKDVVFIGKQLGKIRKLTTAGINTYDKLNDILLTYCNLILSLNGQGMKEKIGAVNINNSSECSYLGTKVDWEVGCKVSTHKEKKEAVATFLKDILVAIFKQVDKDILENSNPYAESLWKSIETYSHFIGSKELAPIYIPYVKMIEEINHFFKEHIIIDRCKPNNREYGCARIVTLVKKKSSENSEKLPPNSFKILLLSSSNESGGNNLENGSNLVVDGGMRSRRFRKKTRKSMKKIGRYRNTRGRRKGYKVSMG